MTRPFTILTILSILISCSYSDKRTSTSNQKDTSTVLLSSETARKIDKGSFQNIFEVVANKKPGTWIHIQDSSSSCALFFNSDSFGTDTLDIQYSPECWFSFPYKISSKQIIVYWDKIIDTKYNFDIVKAVNKIEKTFKGKPFMILELVNDTTLQATYPHPEIIRKLNSSVNERLLFPAKYSFSQTPF